MISQIQMKEFNTQGLIPGPNENEADFLKRAHYCTNLTNELTAQLDTGFPFSDTQFAAKDVLAESFPITESLFDVQ
jgi:hypothetical protein